MSSRFYTSPYDLASSSIDLPSGTFGVGEVERVPSRYDPAQETLQPASVAYAAAHAVIYRPTHLREDETVLACCNHAHEVARAHGAREVMLEHLVHAMARVSEAASVLEEQGILVSELRKESATVISSEIPVCQASGSAALRASTDFNTVMYLAAASASRRGERSTAIRDVLDVLLNYNPRAQAVQMLRKFAPHLPEREVVDPMRDVRLGLERQSNDIRELRAIVSQIVTAQRNDVANVQAVVSQRLDALDRMIAGQLGQRDSDRPVLIEQLRVIEGVVERKFGEAADARGHLDARLDRLEELFGQTDGADGDTKAVLLERLGQIEALFGEGDDSETIQVELFQRLDKLEEQIADRGNDASTSQLLLEERFERLERVISDQGGEMAAITSVIDDRFEDLTRSLSMIDLSGAGGDVEALLDQRLVRMETSTSAKFGEASKAWVAMNERMGRIEQLIGLSRQEGQSVRGLVDARIATLADNIGGRLSGVDQAMAMQHSDMRALQKHLTTDLAEMRRILNRLVHAQQAQAEALLEMRHVSSADLGIISNRLSALQSVTESQHLYLNGSAHSDRFSQAHDGDGDDSAQPPSGPSSGGHSNSGARGIADRTFRALYGSRFSHAIRGRGENVQNTGNSDRDDNQQHGGNGADHGADGANRGAAKRGSGTSRASLANRIAQVASQRTLMQPIEAEVVIGGEGSLPGAPQPRTPAGPKAATGQGFGRSTRRKLANALEPLLQRPITAIAVVAVALGLITVSVSSGDVDASSQDIVGRPGE